ncbi:MAG: FHA domain-containing protein [Bradymonadia bacterium]
MTARLVYIDRGGRQREILLAPGRKSIVVGRHPHCDLVTADASVSRRHCEVIADRNGFLVRDLGSANGTLLNDESIDVERLSSRDLIRCGSLVLQFLEEADASVDGAALAEAAKSPSNGSSQERHPTDKEALKSYVMHLEESLKESQASVDALECRLAESQRALRVAQHEQQGVEGELRALKVRISKEMAQVTPPGHRPVVHRTPTPQQPHPLLATTLDLGAAQSQPAPQYSAAAESDLLAMMLGEYDDWLESLEALEKRVRAHRPMCTPGSEVYALLETLTAELFAHRLAVGSRKSAFLIRAEARRHEDD